MDEQKNQDRARITRNSWIRSGKIALLFLAFGVAWILVSDTISARLFSNVQDVVQFAMIKGLTYVLLSALLIFYLSFTNIRQILHKSMIEVRDKKRIEEQHFLLKALTNASPDLVFYKDREFRYIGCNKAFEEFVGIAEEKIIGKTDYDLFDRKTADLFRDRDQEIVRSGKSIKYEELVAYPDGHTVWVETSKSPFYISNDHLFGLIGVSRDISQRKAMTLQLEKEKKQFETFINSSQDLIFLKDDHFRHLIANKALADYYGKDISELIGKTDYELMSEEHADAFRKSDQTAAADHETLSFIEAVGDRIFEARKFPVATDQGKTGVGAIIRDNTTEYRQQEIISRISETNRIIAQCMMKPFANVQQQLDYALNEALNLTESQYGYIYLFDESTEEFTLNSWTNGVMPDCGVIEKQTKYHLEKTGLWGEVVRQRQPVIVNDYVSPNPLEKGYQEGHVSIHNYMSLPVFENDQIVAVIGFANKKADYSDNDVQTITLLMSGVWIATRKKEKEEETERLLRNTRSMINHHQAVMLLIDPFSGSIIEANKAATDFYGYTQEELLHMTIQDINMQDKEETLALLLKALTRVQNTYTYPHRLKSGKTRIVNVYSSPIEYDDKKVLFSIIFDVTEKEEIAKQNEYIAYHDHLTGLYNRRFFEEEFKRRVKKGEFPVGLLIGDVDGFKVFNDTYGHAEGDKTLKRIADGLSKLVGQDGILARIGGDEFAIIVSGMDTPGMLQYLDKLNQQNDHIADDSIVDDMTTISWGYALQKEREDTLDSLEKEAEAFMYNRKFYSHRSLKSKTVDTIMQTLFTKSEREKKHSDRVGLLSEAIAKQMNLSNEEVNRIRVAGFLHDIGKIGIDEAILNKAGKLDASEWEIMKLHPVKSAGILDKTQEYRDISDIVLSHHERYDGKGYPGQFRGEGIPLEARIIAVADTYDAITNDRPYRKPLDRIEAIEEMKRSAGTQLDPKIVSVLVDMLEKLASNGKHPE